MRLASDDEHSRVAQSDQTLTSAKRTPVSQASRAVFCCIREAGLKVVDFCDEGESGIFGAVPTLAWNSLSAARGTGPSPVPRFARCTDSSTQLQSAAASGLGDRRHRTHERDDVELGVNDFEERVHQSVTLDGEVRQERDGEDRTGQLGLERGTVASAPGQTSYAAWERWMVKDHPGLTVSDD